MRCLIAIALLAAVAVAEAHPEDEFCVPGQDGLDPALCEELNALQSGGTVRPLLDDDGVARSTLSTVWLYVTIGVGHILPGGVDHILFVLALLLGSTRLRSLVLQVTMFTLAHSVTLGMAAAGWLSLNSAWVEALIAISIAFVAVENLVPKLAPKSRLPVVFLFGLLHGLGFAGFFGQLRLPDNQFFAGLIGFNVGVEIGQIGFLLLALAITVRVRDWLGRTETTDNYRHYVVVPASIAIALIGLVWTVERLAAV